MQLRWLVAIGGTLVVYVSSASALEAPCIGTPTVTSGLPASPPSLRTLMGLHPLPLPDGRPRGIGTSVTFAGVVVPNSYFDTLAREFSVLMPENAMKIDSIHPRPTLYDFCDADELAQFALDHGMTMQGGPLVWWNWASQLPNWPRSITDQSALIIAMRDHIKTVITHFKQKFPTLSIQWEVVNEAYTSNAQCLPPTTPAHCIPWKTVIDDATHDHIDLAFQFAHEADPNGYFFYNDYNLAFDATKKQKVLDELDKIRSHTPVHALAEQFHLSLPGVNDSKGFTYVHSQKGFVSTLMNDAASHDLDFIVSELDVAVGADQAHPPDNTQNGDQAQVYDDILDSCLNNSRCSTFVTWGLDDRRSWRSPDTPDVYDGQDMPKPAYHALRARFANGTDVRLGELSIVEAELLLPNAGGKLPASPTEATFRTLRAAGESLSNTFAMAGSSASDYVIDVVARGVFAGGQWPQLNVYINDAYFTSITVDSATWRNFVTVPTNRDAGAYNVRLTLATGGGSVDVDKFAFVTPMIEAEDFYTKTTGAPVPGGWALYENGYIQNSIAVESAGLYKITVRARGTSALTGPPVMDLEVNGVPVGAVAVSSADWADYEFTVALPAGADNIAVAFRNNLLGGSGDRNLFVDRMTFAPGFVVIPPQ